MKEHPNVVDAEVTNGMTHVMTTKDMSSNDAVSVSDSRSEATKLLNTSKINGRDDATTLEIEPDERDDCTLLTSEVTVPDDEGVKLTSPRHQRLLPPRLLCFKNSNNMKPKIGISDVQTKYPSILGNDSGASPRSQMMNDIDSMTGCSVSLQSHATKASNNDGTVENVSINIISFHSEKSSDSQTQGPTMGIRDMNVRRTFSRDTNDSMADRSTGKESTSTCTLTTVKTTPPNKKPNMVSRITPPSRMSLEEQEHISKIDELQKCNVAPLPGTTTPAGPTTGNNYHAAKTFRCQTTENYKEALNNVMESMNCSDETKARIRNRMNSWNCATQRAQTTVVPGEPPADTIPYTSTDAISGTTTDATPGASTDSTEPMVPPISTPTSTSCTPTPSLASLYNKLHTTVATSSCHGNRGNNPSEAVEVYLHRAKSALLQDNKCCFSFESASPKPSFHETVSNEQQKCWDTINQMMGEVEAYVEQAKVSLESELKKKLRGENTAAGTSSVGRGVEAEVGVGACRRPLSAIFEEGSPMSASNIFCTTLNRAIPKANPTTATAAAETTTKQEPPTTPIPSPPSLDEHQILRMAMYLRDAERLVSDRVNPPSMESMALLLQNARRENLPVDDIIVIFDEVYARVVTEAPSRIDNEYSKDDCDGEGGTLLKRRDSSWDIPVISFGQPDSFDEDGAIEDFLRRHRAATMKDFGSDDMTGTAAHPVKRRSNLLHLSSNMTSSKIEWSSDVGKGVSDVTSSQGDGDKGSAGTSTMGQSLHEIMSRMGVLKEFLSQMALSSNNCIPMFSTTKAAAAAATTSHTSAMTSTPPLVPPSQHQQQSTPAVPAETGSFFDFDRMNYHLDLAKELASRDPPSLRDMYDAVTQAKKEGFPTDAMLDSYRAIYYPKLVANGDIFEMAYGDNCLYHFYRSLQPATNDSSTSKTIVTTTTVATAETLQTNDTKNNDNSNSNITSNIQQVLSHQFSLSSPTSHTTTTNLTPRSRHNYERHAYYMDQAEIIANSDNPSMEDMRDVLDGARKEGVPVEGMLTVFEETYKRILSDIRFDIYGVDSRENPKLKEIVTNSTSCSSSSSLSF